MSKRLFTLIFLLLSNTLMAAPLVLTFGVVPQQSSSTLARQWTPLLDQLSTLSGIELRFQTAPDIPTFEARLAEGAYDLAYMNPYHFTVFNRAPGYHALAKAQGKRITGIIVVPKESPIQSVQALEGATLAFPSPAAFAASILTRAHLRDAGVHFTPQYVASHDSVYQAVARGLFPAGGGIPRTFGRLPEALRDQLRVLWKSEGFTPHAFAIHPRVEAAQREALQAALLRLEQSEAGRVALEALGMPALEQASDGDWDDVRALHIELLDPVTPPDP